MNNDHKRIIWLVDENENELQTGVALLRRALPESISIEPILAKRQKEEYLPLLEDERTVAFVLDQKLKVSGIANYSGTELATFLRGVNQKIPIYILTNYAEDTEEFVGSEWSVEDILAKSDLSDEQGKEKIAARLIRRIDVYEDILGAREKRYHELLARSLQGDLTLAELTEIDELQLQRDAPTVANELSRLVELEKAIAAQKKILDQLTEKDRSR